MDTHAKGTTAWSGGHLFLLVSWLPDTRQFLGTQISCTRLGKKRIRERKEFNDRILPDRRAPLRHHLIGVSGRLAKVSVDGAPRQTI